MKIDSKIYVAGNFGLVGSSIVRKLQSLGYNNLVFAPRSLNLMDSSKTECFFEDNRPEYVFLAAAKVGGIMANSTFPAEFIYNNLMIQNNVIEAAKKYSVEKLLFLGSSCIYPKNCPQPIREEYLLTGPLEPTNQAYALAKIAGIEMCKAYNKQYGLKFFSVMPTNLYGPYDNFNPKNSHVIPGLIRKFHDAKINNQREVVLWGTGKPRREFLYVNDLADALVMLMNDYEDYQEIINIGYGSDISILELANLIKKEAGYNGQLVFDDSYPDGTFQKLLNIDKIKKYGWAPTTSLERGINSTYSWFGKRLL